MSDTVLIFIITATIYVVIQVLKKLLDNSTEKLGKNTAKSRNDREELGDESGATSNDGNFQKRYVSWNSSYELEVVGESHYQLELLIVAGAKEARSRNIEVIVELRHEPRNEYDSNAHAVYIKGRQVGYLDRRNALALVREKGKLHLGHHIVLVVKGVITGGWKNARSEGDFGVVLDMPPFKDLSKVISNVSFEDSDQKRAASIPLTREQKRFFDYMGIKKEDDVNSLNVDQKIADKKVEIRSSEDRELKEKLMTYQKRERVIKNLLEEWRDRDNGVIFLYDEIKMPSELQVLKTLEALESQDAEWDEIISDNEMFYNKLIELYPKLEK